jgi:hypothetical protein
MTRAPTPTKPITAGHFPVATTFDYHTMSPTSAEALRKQAARIREQVQITARAIVAIGKDLLAVKQSLGHGRFSQWVEAECGFSMRSADNYIRAATFAEGKMETVSILPPATIYRLASKKAAPEVVEVVISRAESGTVTDDSAVKAMLTEAASARRKAAHQVRQPPASCPRATRRHDECSHVIPTCSWIGRLQSSLRAPRRSPRP